MTCTISYAKRLVRPARELVCVIAALLFSVLIVAEGYSADKNGSQKQDASPVVFSNMSSTNIIR